MALLDFLEGRFNRFDGILDDFILLFHALSTSTESVKDKHFIQKIREFDLENHWKMRFERDEMA